MRTALWMAIAVAAIIASLSGCAKKETKPPVNYTLLKEETLPTGEKVADILVDPATQKEDLLKLARHLNKIYASYTVYDSKEIYEALMNPPSAPTPAAPESASVAQAQAGPTPEEIAAHTLIKKADKNSPAYWIKDNLQEEIK